MAGAASQAGDADTSRALGLASGLQGSVNVYLGALLLVPQWHCISSFVFYIVHNSPTADYIVKSGMERSGRCMEYWCIVWQNRYIILNVDI